jgi:hypothetical protein
MIGLDHRSYAPKDAYSKEKALRNAAKNTAYYNVLLNIRKKGHPVAEQPFNKKLNFAIHLLTIRLR